MDRINAFFTNVLQWDQLKSVWSKNKGPYFLWSLGNLGGLLIAYLASMTIWLNRNQISALLPGPEAFLITGTITLAMAGVSCLSFKRPSNVTLSPLVSASWPFPLMLIYGELLVMGMKSEAPPDIWKYWVIAVVLFALSFAWASLTWLHEQGIRMDMDQDVNIPQEPPKELKQSADSLPKLSS